MNLVPFENLFCLPLRNGVSYPSARRGNGVPMVNMGEAFRFDQITDQECERVPLTDRERGLFLLREGDLLFVRQSLKFAGAGKCIYIGAGKEPRTWESHLIRVRLNPDKADPRYYYYYFRSPYGRLSIETIIEQVAAAGIRGSDLRRLQVPHPDRSEQEKMADVLYAIDDKIAVNDRIIKTAFDIADLKYLQIASRVRHSEKVGDLLELKYGKALPAAVRVDGKFPVYGSGGVAGTHDKSLVEGPGVIVGRKGTVGAVYWSEESFYPIDTTYYVGLRRDEIPMEFAFFMLKHLGLDSMNSDSAVPGLNRSNALALNVRVPDEAEMRGFGKQVRPLFALRASLKAECVSLAALRDALLPKLMSGEIRVRDAEKVVEDVT